MIDGLIDVHHHARPAAFFEALAQTGRTSMAGRPFPPGWTEAGALAMMDENGIATALLSAPDADLLYRDRPIALRLSRLLNDMFGSCLQKRPDRFGAFASLPMPHLDASLDEVAYALDVAGLDGVMLSTSYDGTYLGDASLDPLLSELHHRKALVLVHPVSPMGRELLKLENSPALLEYAFDTTRCIVNLIQRDVPARFPGIRFIFSHAGGTAPYLAERLGMLRSFLQPERAQGVPENREAMLRLLRSFFYDTALSASTPVLELLRDVIGLDRLLFGTDYPQAPENVIPACAAAIRGAASLARGDDFSSANARRLVPRLEASR